MVTPLVLTEAAAMALSPSEPRRRWHHGHRGRDLKEHCKGTLGMDFVGLVAEQELQEGEGASAQLNPCADFLILHKH